MPAHQGDKTSAGVLAALTYRKGEARSLLCAITSMLVARVPALGPPPRVDLPWEQARAYAECCAVAVPALLDMPWLLIRAFDGIGAP